MRELIESIETKGVEMKSNVASKQSEIQNY